MQVSLTGPVTDAFQWFGIFQAATFSLASPVEFEPKWADWISKGCVPSGGNIMAAVRVLVELNDPVTAARLLHCALYGTQLPFYGDLANFSWHSILPMIYQALGYPFPASVPHFAEREEISLSDKTDIQQAIARVLPTHLGGQKLFPNAADWYPLRKIGDSNIPES